MSPRDLSPGDPVESRWRKWPGTEHGDWIGQRAGMRSVRPGAEFTTPVDNVSLLPAGDPAWVGTFFPPGHPHGVRVYVDLVAEVEWSATEPGVQLGIDMDLDVVRIDGRPAFVDDRDEFAEHAAAWGYPAEVVLRLENAAAELLDLVERGAAPFDDATAARWREVLAAL